MDRIRARRALLVLALAAAGACSTAPPSSDEELRKIKDPDVVFVPTPQEVVDMMLHLARVGPKDVVADLGCGDGRVLVTAAKRYGCRAQGYDIDPERVKESRENIRKNGVGRLARVEQKDIFTLDLSGFDVVFLYLLPRLNVRLIPQLEKLKPGSRIVSHDFDMKGVRPDAVVSLRCREDDSSHRIYLWTTPLIRLKEGEAAHDLEEDAMEGWEDYGDEAPGDNPRS